jgi:hypothetical protein
VPKRYDEKKLLYMGHFSGVKLSGDLSNRHEALQEGRGTLSAEKLLMG